MFILWKGVWTFTAVYVISVFKIMLPTSLKLCRVRLYMNCGGLVYPSLCHNFLASVISWVTTLNASASHLLKIYHGKYWSNHYLQSFKVSRYTQVCINFNCYVVSNVKKSFLPAPFSMTFQVSQSKFCKGRINQRSAFKVVLFHFFIQNKNVKIRDKNMR